MVSGEQFRLHKQQFNETCPSFARISGFECDFSPSGNGSVRDHAKQEARDEDSASATRTQSCLPTLIKLYKDTTACVRFCSATGTDADWAERETETTVSMKGDIFEFGFDRNIRLIKVCIRYPYDSSHDQIVVLDLRHPKIVTTWLNHRDDTHNSLNLDEYDSVETVRSQM